MHLLSSHLLTLAKTGSDVPPPDDMHQLMWWIIGTLCTVVTIVVGFGVRMIFRSLAECKEDRKTLFAENEQDRKEFYREVKDLQNQKLRLTHQVAFVAGKCSIDLQEMPEPESILEETLTIETLKDGTTREISD